MRLVGSPGLGIGLSKVNSVTDVTMGQPAATDGRIQEMVRRDFRGNCTVLTIAHRLHTIGFYDRVLLLSQGAVQEYDTPLSLLREPGGAFRKLAEESGDFDGLMQLAAEAAAAE